VWEVAATREVASAAAVRVAAMAAVEERVVWVRVRGRAGLVAARAAVVGRWL